MSGHADRSAYTYAVAMALTMSTGSPWISGVQSSNRRMASLITRTVTTSSAVALIAAGHVGSLESGAGNSQILHDPEGVSPAT
jgi:hypothetical protein